MISILTLVGLHGCEGVDLDQAARDKYALVYSKVVILNDTDVGNINYKVDPAYFDAIIEVQQAQLQLRRPEYNAGSLEQALWEEVSSLVDATERFSIAVQGGFPLTVDEARQLGRITRHSEKFIALYENRVQN